jgi:hypothetical protein
MDGEDDFDGGGYGKLFSLATPALQPEFLGR